MELDKFQYRVDVVVSIKYITEKLSKKLLDGFSEFISGEYLEKCYSEGAKFIGDSYSVNRAYYKDESDVDSSLYVSVSIMVETVKELNLNLHLLQARVINKLLELHILTENVSKSIVKVDSELVG